MVAMNRSRVVLVVAAGLLALGCGGPRELTIASPGGRVSVSFEVRDGTPRYAVQYDGEPVIAPSALGIRLTDGEPLDHGFAVQDHSIEDVDRSWEPVWGAWSTIEDRHRALSVTLKESGAEGRTLHLDFRAYDDGAAFRYTIPAQDGLESIEIAGETTEFRLPADGKAFVLSRRGFGDSYEGTFDPVPLSEVSPETLIGMPLLVEGSGHWVAITEADLTDYAGMSLRRDASDRLKLNGVLAPLEDAEGVSVRGEAPLVTPWRTLLIGERAGDLIESTLVWNLNDPSALEDTSWIRPGKAIWPWWNGRIVTDPKIEGGQPSTAVMRYYTDFAARHQIPHLVVDAGWYSLEGDAWEQPEKEDVLTMEETRAGFYDVQEVIRYAKSKGVAVHLWVHLASLRGRVEEVLAKYAEWGTPGIKLDNFGGDDQGIVNDLHHVIQVAAGHRMTVDYHGAYKPTGVCRTWPNFLTSEGVLGLESSKGRPLPTNQHNVTIPYTRMLAGPMDYTPGAFDLDGTEGSPKHVQGTRAQQIAMYVVYFSPFQMLVDYPAAYEAAPEQFDFVKRVPTSWDETRFVEGYPGDFIVVARRLGDEWYLGAMSDEQERTLALPLDFLTAGREYVAHVFRDGDDVSENPQSVAYETRSVRASDSLEAHLAPGGGLAVRLAPAS
jgi:alpha-glucosidase